MKLASMIAVALCLVACAEEEPERVHLTLEMGEVGLGKGADNEASSLAPPTAPTLGDELTITLGRPVHWIEVTRCETDCDPIPFHGYCMFGSAFVDWETAMGVDYEGKFDDVLRGAPAIAGPITYGELPANAGWQSIAEPLIEGATYAINAYVYEACDTEDDACVHDKAVGCRFFTIQDGQLVDITGEEAEE